MIEGTVGEIRLFAGSFEPRDWLFCNGKKLDISRYTALYTILGSKYGGDGRETFALPDIAPVLGAKTSSSYDDLNYVICISGMYPARN